MEPTKRCPACFETIDARATRCPRCAQRQPDAPGMFRDVPGRLVGGVCAALALHFNVDATVMRVILLASVAVSGGLLTWVYLVLWLMLPFEAGGRSPGQRLVEWVQHLFDAPAPRQAPPSGPQDL